MNQILLKIDIVFTQIFIVSLLLISLSICLLTANLISLDVFKIAGLIFIFSFIIPITSTLLRECIWKS